MVSHTTWYGRIRSLSVIVEEVIRVWSRILLPAAAKLREYVTSSAFLDVVSEGIRP